MRSTDQARRWMMLGVCAALTLGGATGLSGCSDDDRVPSGLVPVHGLGVLRAASAGEAP